MAAAQIEVPSTSSFLRRRASHGAASLRPEYEVGGYVELSALAAASSTSTTSLLQGEAAAGQSTAGASSPSSSSSQTFHSTEAFQIETTGRPLLAPPLPPRPIPTPVYSVDASGAIGGLAYESVRPARRSGNSILLRAGSSEEHPVCFSTYRFGPNRPPKIQLAGREAFQVTSKGLATRAQSIRTHLGTFRWRYAGRQERRAAGADSLLILDRIAMVALAGGKQEERKRPVAKLLRNTEFRTEGSRSYTAGNGGRLTMDLREWLGTMGEAEQMEILVVASCLVMLKKEIDRRMHQVIAVTGAASGGS